MHDNDDFDSFIDSHLDSDVNIPEHTHVYIDSEMQIRYIRALAHGLNDSF
jgi:hypothetical protein